MSVWFSWQDAATQERLGESQDEALAQRLAQELATRPLLDGRTRVVELYHEPAHLLATRFHPDGQVEVVSGGGEARSVTRRRVAGHGAVHRRPAPAADVSPTALLKAGEEIRRRRAQAGVPQDGWHFRIEHVVAFDGDEVAFVEANCDRAQARAELARRRGHPLALVSARDWQPLESAAGDWPEEVLQTLERPVDDGLDERRFRAGVPPDGWHVAYAVAYDTALDEYLFVDANQARAWARLEELDDGDIRLLDSRDFQPLKP